MNTGRFCASLGRLVLLVLLLAGLWGWPQGARGEGEGWTSRRSRRWRVWWRWVTRARGSTAARVSLARTWWVTNVSDREVRCPLVVVVDVDHGRGG